VLTRSSDGQDGNGDAVIDVGLDMLATLLVVAVDDEVINHLIGNGLKSVLPIS
jgi:hypothetical protein